MSFWFPQVEAWIWSLGILVLLLLVNTQNVSRFGEAEYWISMVKVSTVLIFISIGIIIDIFGFPTSSSPTRIDPPSTGPIGFQNWFIHDAPFKNGLHGLFSIISIAFFAFGGTELVGVSAGEVQNPKKNVPRAINSTFWRILFFYIGSIGIIGLLIPHDDPTLSLSASTEDVQIAPFTLILKRAGLHSASNIMNAVILTAVISAANSAMYAASRTLVSMSARGDAPSWLGKVDAKGVPWRALGVTTGISLLAFLGIAWGGGISDFSFLCLVS
jgi:lysine-specific permease